MLTQLDDIESGSNIHASNSSNTPSNNENDLQALRHFPSENSFSERK